MLCVATVGRMEQGIKGFLSSLSEVPSSQSVRLLLGLLGISKCQNALL